LEPLANSKAQQSHFQPHLEAKQPDDADAVNADDTCGLKTYIFSLFRDKHTVPATL
jgi:hypothetical protein